MSMNSLGPNNTFMILPGLTLDDEAQKRFETLMQTIDFSYCENSYQACRLLFKRLDQSLVKMGKELSEARKELKKANEGKSLSEETSETPSDNSEQLLLFERSEIDQRNS